MTINLQTGGYVPPQPLPGARSADVQLGQKQQQPLPAEAPVSDIGQPPSPEKVSPEEKRLEQVVFAAKSLFRDVYAVSDKNFTIFKDASGQYITRYTSLRDGRVTYIPEPKLMQLFGSHQAAHQSVLEIKA
jgi:hypothetical protein